MKKIIQRIQQGKILVSDGAWGTYLHRKGCAAGRPLERIGNVDDVANTVLFLAGSMSAWITGTHIVVDGGGIA
jgi:NAD(P)-dependent dehydrogenase (short-subunit alcohol dehydrogenase family)